jgi:hypothetical protein
MKETEVVKGQRGNPNGYVEFLPVGYDGTKKFPMLTWWHGLGETGSGTDSGLDRLQRNIVLWLRKNDVPFLVLVPQDANGWGKASPFAVWADKHYQTIDQGSKHMAGLSSGGYMIRDFINEGSDIYKTYSTFTPMATNLDSAIPNVKRIIDNDQYIQAHAGENDGGANMVGASARFIAAGQKLDPKRFELIVYDDIGHSAWDYVYNAAGEAKAEMTKDGKLITTFEGAKLREWKVGEPTWFEWLLAHSKSKQPNPPTDPEPPVEIVDGFTTGFIFKGEAHIVTESGAKYKFPVTKE